MITGKFITSFICISNSISSSKLKLALHESFYAITEVIAENHSDTRVELSIIEYSDQARLSQLLTYLFLPIQVTAFLTMIEGSNIFNTSACFLRNMNFCQIRVSGRACGSNYLFLCLNFVRSDSLSVKMGDLGGFGLGKMGNRYK